MSSTTFKNLKVGRKHRERGQLENREHLGLLEKKKDYLKRAKHYHKINDQLNTLKLKSKLKNENEYYHKMTKSKIVVTDSMGLPIRSHNGKHVEQNDDDDEDEDDFDPKEYRRLLKNQNLNLIKIQKHKDMKQIERLKGELQFLDAPKQNSNIIFVDNKAQYETFDLEEHQKETMYNGINSLTQDELELNKSSNNTLVKIQKRIEDAASKQVAQKIKEGYMKLKKAEDNHKKMETAFLKLETEKNLLGKEKRRIKKFKDGKVAKFFLERKR